MEGRLHKIILIIFLLISGTLWSMDAKDFAYYNQVTYDHYLKKEWDQLIQTGKEALDQDFDFYYLRARLGIAYFEKGIYTAAIKHFSLALMYNSSDPIILEYLYYAYIHASRYHDASLLYHQYKRILDGIQLTYKPGFFDAITLDGAYKMSDHRTTLGIEAGDIQYGQIGFSHNMGGHIYLYHYAGLLNHTYADISDMENNRMRYRYHFYQFEYYASAHINLGKGFEINPAFHFIGVDAHSVQYSDFYYGIGIKKRMGRVNLGLQYSYAEVNDTRIEQWVPKILYYPLGNNKLYLSATAIFSQGDLDQRVYQGLMGVRVFPSTWIEGYISSGRSQYLALFDGAILYNNPDYLLSRTGVSVTQFLTEKTSLMLHYVGEKKEQIVSGDPYMHHVFALGLNFKF
jgi:tetratricopeptide (TPR) repeat protein